MYTSEPVPVNMFEKGGTIFIIFDIASIVTNAHVNISLK